MTLIVLAPIKADSPEDHSHLIELRNLLSNKEWEDLQNKYLAEKLPMLHMARFQIIEHLIPHMGDMEKPDRLFSNYLLFIAEIDGLPNEFYDHLYRQEEYPIEVGSPQPKNAGAFARSIWGHCAGYPDLNENTIYHFRQFMQRYQVKPMLSYCGVSATRNEILTALSIKELTAAFLGNLGSNPDLSDLSIHEDTQTYLRVIDIFRSRTPEQSLAIFNYLFKPTAGGTPWVPINFTIMTNHFLKSYGIGY